MNPNEPTSNPQPTNPPLSTTPSPEPTPAPFGESIDSEFQAAAPSIGQPAAPTRQPMKNRNLAAVILLPFVTFGIYAIYWLVSTKNELNKRGASVPTAWLIIIPIVNIWWYWKYSEAVEEQFGSKLSAPISMLLLFLLGSIGQAVIQSSYNKES